MDPYEYRVARMSPGQVLDGDWDGSFWKFVLPLRLSHAMGACPDHFPNTQLKLVYDDLSLIFIFRVEDQFVRAMAQHHQEAVYKDSCVEFFFTPGSEVSQGYFNFEINCGGKMLFHFQKVPRTESVLVAEVDLAKIEVTHSLPDRIEEELDRPIVWIIQCKMPFKILKSYFPNLQTPRPGVRWRANFQKCADDSSHPHWLTWAKINHPVPDFHRPQDFGTLTFE